MTDKTEQNKEPLIQRNANSKFAIQMDDLLRIVNMQNRPTHKGDPQAGEASNIIMNEFGGPEGIASRLNTSTEVGIKWSQDQRQERIEAFGANKQIPPRIKTLMELIMENFEDKINQILLVAAIVSIIIGLIQHGWPEGMLEGTSIMIALCIIIVVSSGNNYASERRLANLVAMADKQTVSVFRNGKIDEPTSIDYEELVVGDLVAVSKGMKCPADLILVQGDQVKCKEDALTGEPDEMEKTPLTQQNYVLGKDSIMFAKSEISNGEGRGIVLAVGDVTEAGKIQKKVQEEGQENEPTLLQQKLNTIADQIGNVGYGCAGLTFVAIVIRLFLENWGVINCGCKNLVTCEAPEKDAEGKILGCVELDMLDFENRFFTELLNTVIIAITVIVVAIPEGLPLAVTISLSFSSAKMQKENNLVRKLASAETMGSVTHICSDKTGTLTQNVMTTMACMSHQQTFRMASEDQPDVSMLANNVKDGINNGWDLLMECALWNNDAQIEKVENKGYTGVENKQYEFGGNVTDQGILKFFSSLLGPEGTLNKMQEKNQTNSLCKIKFDSSTKRATQVILREDGTVRVYTKGAPDVLFGKNKADVDSLVEQIQSAQPSLSLAEAKARAEKAAPAGMVTRVAVPGGTEDWTGPASFKTRPESIDEIMSLSGRQGQAPDNEEVFQATVKDFARQAYRTILCCYKDMSRQEYEALKSANNDFESEKDRQVLEQDLIAIGIFGIQDPLRDTIVASVERVSQAHIKVIMCTGDNLDTATAISKNAGIIPRDDTNVHQYQRMEGQTFRKIVGGLKKLRDPKCEETDPAKFKYIEYLGDQGKFNQVIKHLRVLARSSPQDKYLLVTGLQASPYTADIDIESQNLAPESDKPQAVNYCSVAVTGDGTNDAPALSKANVGFSMGITGTDIAKGASDIILLDDNFASIITALRYGRNIYDNVRKFLQFQLTVNVVAMFIVFFGSLMLNDSPLNAVQMLWVNLIMDTLAALALATEPPDENILERKPQPSSTSIVTEIMWRNVHGHAIYQMITLIVIIFAAQGSLVPKYDIKCMVPRENNGPCPKLGLNPFYTAELYYFKNGETMEYWKGIAAKDGTDKEEAFQPDAWAEYQCSNLNKNFDLGEIVCSKDNYATLLKDKLSTATDEAAKKLGGSVGNYYYLPQVTIEEGSGTEKLLHMTYVFQIFVFMQIFNQVNARILTGSLNIFEGICKNWLFIGVALSTFVVQMAMVEVGGKVTKTYPLEMYRNGYCLIFGAGELIWGVLIKSLPLRFFQCVNFEETPMTDEQHEKSLVGKMKGGSSVHKRAKKMGDDVGSALIASVKKRESELTAVTNQ